MTLAKWPANGYGDQVGNFHYMPNYMAVTSLDATTTYTGAWYDNRDGNVKRVAFTQLATNTGGTTNTLQTTLQGSFDGGTTVFTVLDSGGNAIQTTALDTSGADGTAANYASESEDTNQEGVTSLPPLFRLRSVSTGTSDTLTGNVALLVERNPRNPL